jgi:hypothetical protein
VASESAGPLAFGCPSASGVAASAGDGEAGLGGGGRDLVMIGLQNLYHIRNKHHDQHHKIEITI